MQLRDAFQVLNKCDDCGASPHDVAHLFVCPTKVGKWGGRAALTPCSLWDDPVKAAEFLELKLDDSDD